MMTLTFKILTNESEMVNHLGLMRELYPDLIESTYQKLLADMLPLNYKQVAVYSENECVGVSGYWIGTKLWSGKYMELDNVVIHHNYRNKKIGQQLYEFLEIIAQNESCNMIVLDAFTNNFKAQKFYHNLDFNPLGYHFVKYLNS